MSILAVAIGAVSLNLWPLVVGTRSYKVLPAFAMVVVSMYGTMMFASSYVEEEHHFWYWASSGWLTLLLLKA